MFLEAKPIWAKGQSERKNTFVVFTSRITARDNLQLHIAGTAFYRVFVNDSFLAAGPARCAAGYVREDILHLPQKNGDLDVVIEAVGYYCKSLATVQQPACLMAEVRCGQMVVATLNRDFTAYMPPCKVRKVERYSAQRHFTEVWDYRQQRGQLLDKWKTEMEELVEKPKVIDRVAPYPLYWDVSLSKATVKGTYEFREDVPYIKERYSWKMATDWGFFPYEEIEHHPFAWVQRLKQHQQSRNVALPLTLQEGEYAIFDFSKIEAGFITAALRAVSDCDVVISFCEYMPNDVFRFQNMNVHNVLEFFLDKEDERKLQSFEPYTFRFVMVAVRKGTVVLNSLGVKTYMFDITGVKEPDIPSEELKRIYRAAVRTFAHNAVELYSDCPSRERAGWLCDTYFTAKTEYCLTGKTGVEDAFLENYRLFENKGDFPQGMIPKCYPSDAMEHQPYIPQWTMWYILEVEEYVHKRGNEDKKELFRKSIYDLLDFYRSYENEDGLLENLPGWNFVEWSKANEWTQNVNYPTNFLYAKVLDCVARLYNDKRCAERSAWVRETAIKQSFKGGYFRDHAMRDARGVLQLCEEASEACQYYAVLFGQVDIDAPEYAYLKHLILHVFSPERENAIEQIFPVNMFIGAYLRLEALLKMKQYDLVLQNVAGFFGNMEAYTGTLWEYKNGKGSYDHGFASYALVVILDALANTHGRMGENKKE